MKTATVRFYAELNDFLGSEGPEVTFRFQGTPSVKDAVEALGVPHPEVELILLNGNAVDFHSRLQDGDRMSVYPVFERLDLTPLLKLRPAPLRITRFVLDVHLGRLAAYLRLLGFDCFWNTAADDPTLARISAGENRILLTRDRGLLKRNQITRGLWIRSTEPREQLREVLRRLDLGHSLRPFTRCLKCNHPIVAVKKEEVSRDVPPRSWKRFTEFFRCSGCSRVYWKGSHFEKMTRFLEEL